MKKIIVFSGILFLMNINVFSQNSYFANKSADFGIAVGAWFGGEVNLADFNTDINKETSFLLHGFADFYLIEKLAMGVYAYYSNSSFEEVDETASIYEFGVSIKPRFITSGGALAIKPGLQIGYRSESVDVPGADDVAALGVNLSLELQFYTNDNFAPFGIIGFLSQPAGGSDETNVTFAPIFYIGGGIVF